MKKTIAVAAVTVLFGLGHSAARADLTTDTCLPGFEKGALAGVAGCYSVATGDFYYFPFSSSGSPEPAGEEGDGEGEDGEAPARGESGDSVTAGEEGAPPPPAAGTAAAEGSPAGEGGGDVEAPYEGVIINIGR